MHHRYRFVSLDCYVNAHKKLNNLHVEDHNIILNYFKISTALNLTYTIMNTCEQYILERYEQLVIISSHISVQASLERREFTTGFLRILCYHNNIKTCQKTDLANICYNTIH